MCVFARLAAATPTIEPKAQPISDENKNEWLQTRPGERCLIHISARDTNGAYSVVEIVSDLRDGTPMHTHQNEVEANSAGRAGDDGDWVLEGLHRMSF